MWCERNIARRGVDERLEELSNPPFVWTSALEEAANLGQTVLAAPFAKRRNSDATFHPAALPFFARVTAQIVQHARLAEYNPASRP